MISGSGNRRFENRLSPSRSRAHTKHSCQPISSSKPVIFEIHREKSPPCPKAAGSFVTSKRRVSETMSACIINSYGDCYRDFDRRSGWPCREGVGSGEQSQKKPESTQIDHKFVETKRHPKKPEGSELRRRTNRSIGCVCITKPAKHPPDGSVSIDPSRTRSRQPPQAR